MSIDDVRRRFGISAFPEKLSKGDDSAPILLERDSGEGAENNFSELISGNGGSEDGPIGGAAISFAEALPVILKACASDDVLARSLLSSIGWDRIEKLAPGRVPVALPIRDMTAIEISIGDDGANRPTAKRRRWEQERLRYILTMKVFDRSTNDLRKPVWKGYAHLRDVKRAEYDLEKVLTNSKRCATPFSAEYADWLKSEIFPLALQRDLWVGFVMSKPRGGGTYYHDHQVILVSPPSVAGAEDSFALLVDRAGTVMLPRFSVLDAAGKHLAGSFVAQSRAQFKTQFDDWKTGDAFKNLKS